MRELLDAIGPDLDIAVRLVIAAVLGALIGLEREIHDHPAGMRTHLLVSLGSAGFTVLSIEGFPAPPGSDPMTAADPARIAAQIVSGIGFLGAGAILKEGATIRGLTTAANLWAVAAVGMAAGAGAWLVAVVAGALILFSLWPLRIVTLRFVGKDQHRTLIRVATGARGLGQVVDAINARGGTIAHLESRHEDQDRLHIDVEFKAADMASGVAVTRAIAELEGVVLLESSAVGE
jgi:putative Mg2+ transporter-C (MgtC) family protein